MKTARYGGIAVAAVLLGLGGVAVGSALVNDDTTKRASSGGGDQRAQGTEQEPRTQAARAWRNLAPSGAEEVEHFTTLAELSDTTDVVLTGVVAAATAGRTITDGNPADDGQIYQFLELTVEVQDDLADATNARYAVEFGPYIQEDLTDATWPATLVGDEGVFVLRRKGSANPETGAPQVDSEFALNKFRLVSSQGLLLNDAGEVGVPLVEDPGFPSNLEGADFEATVVRVDQLAD